MGARAGGSQLVAFTVHGSRHDVRIADHPDMIRGGSQANLLALGDGRLAIGIGPDLNDEPGEADKQATAIITDTEDRVGERAVGGG